jgi:hypothetical protein
MTCSTSVQIYKKFRSRELFVPRVQTGLSNLVPDLEIFQISVKQVAIFEMPYLLKSRELYCAYEPDYSATIVEHNGTLPVQNSALVDLQWVQQ